MKLTTITMEIIMKKSILLLTIFVLIYTVGCSDEQDVPTQFIPDGTYRLSGQLSTYAHQIAVEGGQDDTNSVFGPEYEGIAIHDTTDLLSVIGDTILLFRNRGSEVTLDTIFNDPDSVAEILEVELFEDFVSLLEDLNFEFLISYTHLESSRSTAEVRNDTLEILFDCAYVATYDSIVGTDSLGNDSIATYSVKMQATETEWYTDYTGDIPPLNWPTIQ